MVKPVEVKMVPLLPTITNLPFPYVIPLRCFLFPDFFLVQDFPFDEERMVPVLPTTAKVLFPYEAPLRDCFVPDFLLIHDFPFDEVRITPL